MVAPYLAGTKNVHVTAKIIEYVHLAHDISITRNEGAMSCYKEHRNKGKEEITARSLHYHEINVRD